jgi:hypothetical protein
MHDDGPVNGEGCAGETKGPLDGAFSLDRRDGARQPSTTQQEIARASDDEIRASLEGDDDFERRRKTRMTVERRRAER